jgi:hypothetical protein
MLAAGLIKAGEPIEVRRRSRPPVAGLIRKDGRIEALGRVYDTPSAAARDALEVGSADGWLRWRVVRLGGKSLAEVRNELS